MKYSLKTKLTVSYILVALLSVAVLSLVSNFLFEKQFQTYIIKQQEQKNQELAGLISQQYNEKNSSWDKTIIENIGINALEQGLIIKVKDITGKVLWDATVHNNGLCTQMISHMSQNMSQHYPNFKGGYVENKYQLTHSLIQIGSIDIGYYGPFYLNDNDLAFINTLNKMLISVGVFSLLFALILGTVMAKRISTPISRTIQTARQISKGYFEDRITISSNTKEIEQLTSTINNLAETLEKQETLRKRLTADVAHELRTPLATLQSHMEAMIDGIWKPETVRLKSCHEDIMRISRMIGDLEKLARFEGENLILNKTRFDLSELISHTIKNFETEFLIKGVKIVFTNNEQEENIIADRDKISQVLVNLLSNALKYTPQGGSVSMMQTSAEQFTEISIKDTGMGIPPEDLPYIFERFYRADKSRNRLTGGSGIGLTIVKAIVDAHNGKITVQSELDKGTGFVVSLPKF